MKTMRMTVGIISMVLFLIVIFQSCAAGLGNTLAQTGEVSGSAGVFLGLFMLIAGIVGVAARKSRAGAIVATCFYAVGGLVGICNAGTFQDLIIWSIVSFLFAILFLISVILQKGNSTEK